MNYSGRVKKREFFHASFCFYLKLIANIPFSDYNMQ